MSIHNKWMKEYYAAYESVPYKRLAQEVLENYIKEHTLEGFVEECNFNLRKMMWEVCSIVGCEDCLVTGSQLLSRYALEIQEVIDKHEQEIK